MANFSSPCRYCGRLSTEEPLQSSVASFCLPCCIRSWFPNLTRLQRRLAIWFYAGFAALTFLIMLPGAVSGHGEPIGHAILASLFAFLGPFTGAIARGDDSAAYMSFGLRIFPFCAVAAGVAIFFQFYPLETLRVRESAARTVRTVFWAFGLLSWFGGTILSVLLAVV